MGCSMPNISVNAVRNGMAVELGLLNEQAMKPDQAMGHSPG